MGEVNIDWYGVVKMIYTLDFSAQKEVVLFECDWYDVPPANKSKDNPFFLGTQAEHVFYVKGSKKLDWWTVIRMKPRNMFAMPELVEEDNEGEIDFDSHDVGVQDMIDSHTQEELTHWTRLGIEGVIVDTSVIKKAHDDFVPEPTAMKLVDDEEDDTTNNYIDDGYVAPVNSNIKGMEEPFFI
uniref:DUF4216 domain-containing protein n=1 Tax=Setaria viridis TaxID=4556 RepID=A0A4U6TS10_SETVI|nr:hypothetical protein SEVIR_7G028800v2 [Setaria viridis]